LYLQTLSQKSSADPPAAQASLVSVNPAHL
jgi:hypothetical protein